MGGFVTEAKQVLEKNLKLPPGYYVAWSGQWENQVRAKARLQILVLVGIVIIFILLYFTFHSALEASMVMLSVPLALVGGVFLTLWIFAVTQSIIYGASIKYDLF